MAWIINNPTMWHLYWFVGGAAVLLGVAAVMQLRAIRRFVNKGLQRAMLPGYRPWRTITRAVLVIIALGSIAAAMLDIRWGHRWRDIPQKGIDVVFALDTSRSMLAQDVSPNRLDRAEQYIKDMLKVMGGDRVGLLTFAGSTRQVVPLTTNYSELISALDDVSTKSTGAGGSKLGNAVRAAARCFLDKTPDHKAIVLITDGEDQESDPVQAAKDIFKEKGIRVYTVALGDMNTGARIPLGRRSNGEIVYLHHGGKEVWSKMDGKVLKAMALAAGGAYIPAGTKQVDMADVYHDHIASIRDRQLSHERSRQYIPRYQWFAAIAFLALLLDLLIGGRRWRREKAIAFGNSAIQRPIRRIHPLQSESHPSAEKKNNSLKASLFLAAICLPFASVKAAEPVAAASATQPAINHPAAPSQPETLYNQGVELYRQKKYDQAEKQFRKALQGAEPKLTAACRYNLGNCHYVRALGQVDQKKNPQAIKELDAAIRQYNAALKRNAGDADARVNIELAQVLKKQIKEQEKKKQQQKNQQKQQQNQKKQDQNKQDQKNQQNKQDKQDQQKKDQKQKQNQDQKNQKDQQNKKSNQQKKQDSDQKDKKDQKNDQKNKKDNQDKKSEKEKNQQSKNDKKEKDKQQKQNSEQKDKKDQKDNQKQDQKPQDKNKKDQKSKDQQKSDQQQNPNNKPQSQKQQNQDSQDQSKPSAGNQVHADAKDQKAQPVSPEQVQRLLQSIRDKDFLRKKRYNLLRQQQQQGRAPVDRDW